MPIYHKESMQNWKFHHTIVHSLASMIMEPHVWKAWVKMEGWQMEICFFLLVNDTRMAKIQPQNYGTCKLEMEKLGQPIRR
jgi:hypothetical protein